MIATKAGEQLAPFMSLLVPRLYRYQFDPNTGIRQAMTSIWNALVTDKTTVSTPFQYSELLILLFTTPIIIPPYSVLMYFVQFTCTPMIYI